MDGLTIAASLFLAGALYLGYFCNSTPLENSLPLLGHLVYFGQISPYVHDKFHEWSKKYEVARLNFWLPGVAHLDSVITFNVKDLETVLRDPYNFVKGRDNQEIFHEFFGNGIFGSDGDAWKVQRKVASNIFNIRSFRDAYTPIFADDARHLRSHLDAVYAASQSDPTVFVDIQDLLLRSTMDSFVKLATGYDLGNLSGKGTIVNGKYTLHDIPFAQAFDKHNILCTKRASNPLWKITELLDGSKQVSKWCSKTLSEFSLKVINDKRAKLEKAGGSKPENERSDLLDFFMEVKHDDGTPITTRELQDMIINMVG